ncbi:hypothetical protein HELRODRAFT_166064 [Helobdella robusta]|uniref:protein-tyrosine-phosphatase n=1 Tax=Helobdella robusta TaxID=6412 RepID=T1EXP1_HELRO|nr:hypothetical protein HELRODRAFT_166064 [Helobdella robusta]ESN90399.1 hypothetical protein HELRODRAFT_166064 [Helobdella robusta]
MLITQETYSTHPGPPTIITAPRNQTVEVTKSAMFVCKVSGSPTPTVLWFKNNKLMDNSSKYTITTFPQGSVLRIEQTDLKMNDVEFECMAQNNSSARRKARLRVISDKKWTTDYPTISEHPHLQSVEKDKDAELKCVSFGAPPLHTSWYKDNIPIEESGRYRIEKGSGALKILKSQESDEGKYMCSVENKYGTVNSFPAIIYVKARRVPPAFTHPPKNVLVSPGDSVNLTCAGSGTPTPTVRWIRDEDQTLLGKVDNNNLNYLTVEKVYKSENITCVLSSDLGNVEHVAEIRIKALPPPPENLHASEIMANSVKLMWNSVPNAILYHLVYRQKNAQAQGRNMNEYVCKQTECTVTKLHPYAQYEFRVSAENNVGKGPPSAPYDVRTGETNQTSKITTKPHSNWSLTFFSN